MKVRFDVFEMDGYFEMNEKNIKRAEKICDDMSGNYANYVLSIGWDYKHNEIVIDANGPWEC